jgi:hypothetical protein
MDLLSEENKAARDRIIHKARNLWQGKIKLELLKEHENKNVVFDTSLTQEQVIRKVMNILLYELTIEKDKKACDYWMELSLYGSTELLKEAFPSSKYII